jgi:hypothetical protein
MKSFVTFFGFLLDSYTARRGLRAAFVLSLPVILLACIPVGTNTKITPTTLTSGGWYTRHYDSQRSGVNPNETQLTPSTVGYGTFGRLYSYATDGYTYAQPLYASGLTIGKNGNVLFVATSNDTVYAFDADTNTTLWQKSFLNTASNVTYISQADTVGHCPATGPKIGITGTPVIDPTTNTLYVVAATKQITPSGVSTFAQTLHALDLTTGDDIVPAKVISAKNFDPLRSNQRTGLVLNKGKIYISFASLCDSGPYVGMILAYNTSDLSFAGQALAANPPPTNSIDPNPNGGEAGIWMSGMAPAVDSEGNLYASTGNGNWDGKMNSGSLGCSILQFSDLNGPLAVTDFYTPFDFQPMNNPNIDKDLSSAGVIVLPDQSGGKFPHLLVAAGKTGQVYLINRDKMGELNTNTYNTALDDSDGVVGSPNPPAGPPPSTTTFPKFLPGQSFSNIVQSWNLNNNPTGYDFAGYGSVSARDGLFGTPAFFNGKLYFGPSGDAVKAYQLQSDGTFTTDENGVVMPVDQGVAAFGWPGITPSISANGTQNGIVWLVDVGNANADSPDQQEAILNAYNANNLANGRLYNSELSASYWGTSKTMSEHAGPAVKYASPTVYNGHVYFATKSAVEVYGLIPGGKPIAQTPQPPAAPTTTVNLNLAYDSSVAGSCPDFTPASQYQFVIQPCGAPGPYPACETQTSLSGGVQGSLEQFALLPVSSAMSTPVKLIAGQQYELLPATNYIPNNGGFTTQQGIAIVYTTPVPFTFVANQGPVINAKFYCGLATVTSAIPAQLKLGPPQPYSKTAAH